jgi:cell division protein FtsW (lipid II flippase)
MCASRWKWFVWIGAGVVCAAVLFLFDPAACGFFPPCVFHRLTGLWCPGCGSTRALHQLAHGHLSAAFDLNPLMVLMLPVLGCALVLLRVHRVTGKPSHAFIASPVWAWLVLGCVAVFWILRNLPFEPFRRLAP